VTLHLHGEDDEKSEIATESSISSYSAASLNLPAPPGLWSSLSSQERSKPEVPKRLKRTKLHPIFQPFSPLRIDLSAPRLRLTPMLEHEKLNRYATLPSLSVMYLVHPRLGQIKVRSLWLGEERKVNIWDVIYGLHKALHKPLPYRKYMKLSTARKLIVGWAYCQRALNNFKDSAEGLKVVDLLGPERVFLGLEPVPSLQNTFLICFEVQRNQR
jgi:hypothetical protein